MGVLVGLHSSQHLGPLQVLQEGAVCAPAEVEPHFRQSTCPLFPASLTHPSPKDCGLCALVTHEDTAARVVSEHVCCAGGLPHFSPSLFSLGFPGQIRRPVSSFDSCVGLCHTRFLQMWPSLSPEAVYLKEVYYTGSQELRFTSGLSLKLCDCDRAP